MCNARNYTLEELRIMRNIRKTHAHVCFYCKKPLSRREITLDHVLPICRGGQTTRDNLVIACKDCNEEKAEMNLEEYIEYSKIKSNIFSKFNNIITDLKEELENFNFLILEKDYNYLKNHNVKKLLNTQIEIINLLKVQRDTLINNKHDDFLKNLRYKLQKQEDIENDLYNIKQTTFPTNTEKIEYVYKIIADKTINKKFLSIIFEEEKEYFKENSCLKAAIEVQNNKIYDTYSYARFLILKQSNNILIPVREVNYSHDIKNQKFNNATIVGNNNNVNINFN